MKNNSLSTNLTPTNDDSVKRMTITEYVSLQLDPYRDVIQQCLDARLTVQKIYEMMAGYGVGGSFFSFSKYIRNGGYIYGQKRKQQVQAG